MGRASNEKIDMEAKRVTYIAGPMRGIRHYNFPAFDDAKALLTMDGHAVISPADIDRESGFDEKDFPDGWNWHDVPEGFDMRKTAIRDIEAISACNTIYMLKGWEGSTGAKAELAFAKWLGLEVIYEHQESVLDEAKRIQGGDRQKDYGHPSHDFQRIATMWNVLFSEFIEDGELNLPPMAVAMGMAAVKLSRQANRPKRDNWVDIAGYAQCGQLCDEVK